MNKKYLTYSIEELVDDVDFIAFILRNRNQEYYNSLIEENNDFSKKANIAKEIIQMLNNDSDIISNVEIHDIWKGISEFDVENNKKNKLKKLQVYWRVAAVVFLFILAGVSGYYYLNNTNNYQFTEASLNENINHAKLILSDGSSIDLLRKESSIQISSNHEVIIDSDSIIAIENDLVENSENRINEVIVPFGKKTKLELEDGTLVWLNAGTRFAFPSKFDKKAREVFLKGEGYFEVAHDATKPFYVNLNDIKVKVQGTRFNITSYDVDNVIHTVLIDGSVSIVDNTPMGFMRKELKMTPNQKASYSKSSGKITVVDEPDVEYYIAWTEGWFQFSRESLNTVLHRLERFYNVSFVFDSNFPSTELITGKLDLKDSLDDVLAALSDVAKIQYRIEGNRILVDKRMRKLPIRK